MSPIKPGVAVQPQPRLVQLTLADTPNAVTWARRHAVDVLRSWQVPASVVETARLVVSELATNAIRHTRPGEEGSPYSLLSPVRTIALTLRLHGEQLIVLVQDDDHTAPVSKQVGTEAEGGRGLSLVQAFSRRWGYYFSPGLPGKVVWAELALTELPTGDQPGPEAVQQAPSLLTARALAGLREL